MRFEFEECLPFSITAASHAKVKATSRPFCHVVLTIQGHQFRLGRKAKREILSRRVVSVDEFQRQFSEFLTRVGLAEESGGRSPPASVRSVASSKISFLKCTGIEQVHYEPEVDVFVKRGEYAGVNKYIVLGSARGYIIDGPTGCGKSTVALLQLFMRPARVLVVEPTQANAANILHEFRSVLPALASRGIVTMPIPRSQFVSPLLSNADAPLCVTSADKFVEAARQGRYLSSDYLVLDEFHLPIPEVVEAVEFSRSFSLSEKFILVSATPPGRVSKFVPPAAVTVREVELPSLTTRLERTLLDPRQHCEVGSGCVGIVTSSVEQASFLFDLYRSWNLRVFRVTRLSYISDYLKAVARPGDRLTYVLEPGVEAGVTIPLDVLISLGTAESINFRSGVVYRVESQLAPAAAVQRAGRGGRVRPTLYLTPSTSGHSASPAAYYRAQTFVRMVAMGLNPESYYDKTLFLQFPILKGLTRECATSAFCESDPYVSVYKYAENGRRYIEFGGKEKGFSSRCVADLRVYCYGSNSFFVSPVADFSQPNTEPHSFIDRNSQFTVLYSVVSSTKNFSKNYPLGKLVDMFLPVATSLLSEFMSMMKVLFPYSEATPYSFSPSPTKEAADYPTLDDFFRGSDDLLRVFRGLVKLPQVSLREDKEPVQREQGGYVARVRRSLHAAGQVLHFKFGDKYTKEGRFQSDVFTPDVSKRFVKLLAVEIARRELGDRFCDLRGFSSVIRNHVWFLKNVVDGSE